jgi:hypothetical protein
MNDYHPVTDVELPARRTDDTCNAPDVDQILANLGLPTHTESEEERRQNVAQSAARICGGCGKELSENASVWLQPVRRRMAFGSSSPLIPFGRCCVPEKDDFAKLGRCQACDRRVYLLVYTYRAGRRYRQRMRLSRLVYCSLHCRQAVYAAVAKARRERNKVKRLSCMVCGKEFPPTRSDARACSSACRQKAYRDRRSHQAAITTGQSPLDTDQK